MGPRGETILLVDDEAADRQWMKEALTRGGYTVFEAGDYDSALAAFEKHRGEIDLAVTDVSLPGRNGCELAKTLLAKDPSLRALFISGHVGAAVCQFYGIDAGDLFFLRKPFTPHELTRRVRKVLVATEPLPSILTDWKAGASGGS